MPNCLPSRDRRERRIPLRASRRYPAVKGRTAPSKMHARRLRWGGRPRPRRTPGPASTSRPTRASAAGRVACPTRQSDFHCSSLGHRPMDAPDSRGSFSSPEDSSKSGEPRPPGAVNVAFSPRLLTPAAEHRAFLERADKTTKLIQGRGLFKFSPIQPPSFHRYFNGGAPATLYSLGMRRWSLVCLLCLGIVIAYIDRTNLSVSLASADFKALFHLTDKDRGLLGSAFFWSYAILQIPAGAVADRFGVKFPSKRKSSQEILHKHNFSKNVNATRYCSRPHYRIG